jgi:hypothetical protein
VLVLAPPPQPVVLLGEVGELEVEGERAEYLRLALERQRGDGRGQLGAGRRPARRPRPPGELADPLLGREQLLPALLDEDAAEDLAEQADVPPQRCVGAPGGQGRVTAPSLADETSAAYFASTPES